MRLDRALSLISASLIAAILLIGGVMTLAGQRALLTEAETIQIEDASTVLSTVMDQAATLSATHAESLAADAAIAGLMAEGDRRALLDQVKPAFERLNAGGGVNVMHFHTAQMTSFLRVWEPDNFGQDLSTFRPMVVAVNRDRRTRKGLELGVKGLSLRAVSAIVSPEGLAGTVEIGVDLTALLHLAKAATGADYALFLDPSAAVREDGTRFEGRGALALEAATEAAFFGRLQQSGAVGLSRAPEFATHKAEGRTFGVMGRPLLDYSGNLIGTLVIARDFTGLESHLSRAIVTLAAISLCGFLIAYPVFVTAIRALVIRPLTDLTQYCAAEAGTALPPASSRLRDYLDLRAAIERLRDKPDARSADRGEAP